MTSNLPFFSLTLPSLHSDLQSFQFLLDVFEFKNDIVLDAAANGEDRKGFKGFGGYLAIVNDYIKDGAPSEVNIEFRTKRDITKHTKFTTYSSLDLVSERHTQRNHTGKKQTGSEREGEIVSRSLWLCMETS